MFRAETLPTFGLKEFAVDSRQLADMRARVDQLLIEGWSIAGREPLRLQRGRSVKVARGRALIDG